MKLTPVESSHIAAVGYLEDERVLLVRYRDGALYARLGVSASDYEGFMCSSKGVWLSRRTELPYILISKGVMPNEPERSTAELSATLPVRADVAAPADNAPPSAGVLNVIDEDADKCCVRRFNKRDNVGGFEGREIWACLECGTEFHSEMVGPNRYWRIVPHVAIVMPQW